MAPTCASTVPRAERLVLAFQRPPQEAHLHARQPRPWGLCSRARFSRLLSYLLVSMKNREAGQQHSDVLQHLNLLLPAENTGDSAIMIEPTGNIIDLNTSPKVESE